MDSLLRFRRNLTPVGTITSGDRMTSGGRRGWKESTNAGAMHHRDRPSAVCRLHPRPAGQGVGVPGVGQRPGAPGRAGPASCSAPPTPRRGRVCCTSPCTTPALPRRTPAWPGRPLLEGARTRVGEVLYAIDPEIAPAWPAKDSGIVEVWAGSGYGLRRSVPRMIEEIKDALDTGRRRRRCARWTARHPLRREHARARGPRAALAERALVATGADSSRSCASWTRWRPLSTMACPRRATRAAASSRPISI